MGNKLKIILAMSIVIIIISYIIGMTYAANTYDEKIVDLENQLLAQTAKKQSLDKDLLNLENLSVSLKREIGVLRSRLAMENNLINKHELEKKIDDLEVVSASLKLEIQRKQRQASGSSSSSVSNSVNEPVIITPSGNGGTQPGSQQAPPAPQPPVVTPPVPSPPPPVAQPSPPPSSPPPVTGAS